jgi:small subunit ribosomal protein S8
MMTDPIADMLTRIRNAQAARREIVVVPFSKMKFSIAEIIKTEGYINDVTKREDGFPAELVITLKYEGRDGVIQSIKRESKPGHRMYRKYEDLPKILNNFGVAILSTSQGLMTNKKAKELGIGGEVICSIY